MRRKIYSNGIVNCKAILIFIFIMLFINIIATNQIIADSGERLEIVAPEEVYEGEYFSISVIDPDIIEDSPWLVDLEIEFRQFDIYFH